jgi:Spy/CpxP family protein refolding chaperone
MAQADHPPRPPMQKQFHMHFGRWWNKPDMVKKLNLSSEQRKKMDQIFDAYGPKLEHLHANLHRQEDILGPMIGADNPNEGQILAQIDVVAQARANLEKEFARMLLGLQRQLTHQQWEQLRELHKEHMEQMQKKWHHDHHGPPPPPPPHN